MGFFKTLFGGKEEADDGQKAEKKEEYNFEVLTYDGTQALHIGKTDYAIACLTRALDIHEDEDTRLKLAQAFIQKDRLEDAAAQYRKLGELAPDNPAYPLTEAEIYFQTEQYDLLQSACTRALAISPGLAMPHYYLARMYLAQHRPEEAAGEASVAIGIKADYDEACFVRAQALAAAQRYDEATAELDGLLAHGYATDEVLMERARLSALLNRPDEAIAYYQKVIAQNPFIPAAYVELRDIYGQQGQTDKAGQIQQEAMEQFGTDPATADLSASDEGKSIEETMQRANFNPFINANQ